MTGPFVYVLPATIDSWHDGDTCYIHLGISPGLELHGIHCRVQGIDAPELSTPAGPPSRDAASALAPPGTAVTVSSSKRDKYGRFLARIILPDGRDFSEVMIASGYARPFMV